MMLSRMSRNGCETTDMQKMVVVVRQQRNSMKTCRGSNPAIRGIDMISILHNFTANLSPHISQLPIGVDDRVRIDKADNAARRAAPQFRTLAQKSSSATVM